MNYPKRKRTRLQDFDYSENGAYFITICTKHRKNILGSIPVKQKMDELAFTKDQHPSVTASSKNKALTVGQADLCLPSVELTALGMITEKYIRSIPSVYPDVSVDVYVIMPNHIHMILSITSLNEPGRQESACPTISDIIRSFKIMIRKETRQTIFQSSFHDHIIRNQRDYEEIYTYIQNNPAKWEEDALYEK